jgi:DNA-binding transcriptional LysR family regulator
MHFTLKQLRYFNAALRGGSIAAAAAEMNISQSSITAAIDQLETAIGTELFRRVPAKGLVATESGREVGARVARFLEQTRIFENDLMSLRGAPTGSLNLACYAPTAPYVLPILLKRVTQDYPDIRVDLKEGDMDSITAQLNAGAVDLALTYRRAIPETMPFLELFRARPWVLIPDSWEMAKSREIKPEVLSGKPMIMLDLPQTEVYFRSIFENRGIDLRIEHRTKSSSVLRGLVAANFGYSILNIYGHGDRDGRGGYVARPLVGEVEEPRFGVAYTAATQRSAIVQAVLAIGAELAEQKAFDSLILRPRAG